VVHSGLPRRLRPGFWDNNGRCCGTAGVLALACDRTVERGDGATFARVLVDDLAVRASTDAGGVRWSNVEHRVDPSWLPPRTGWAMGSAGIIRELLRYVRVTTGRDQAYAVAWPDHSPAVPRRHPPAPVTGATGHGPPVVTSGSVQLFEACRHGSAPAQPDVDSCADLGGSEKS
jgi:hypothetical protein